MPCWWGLTRPKQLSMAATFSSQEPTILMTCGKNRELWEQPFRACAIDEDWVKPDGQNSVISFVISKWLFPELSIPAAGQKDRRLWGRECGCHILVPRGRAPFGQHQESRPLARSNDIPVLNGFVNTIDWNQNQSDLSDLTQSMRRVTGSPWIADTTRGRDSWCWPKGARPLGTRMVATTVWVLWQCACVRYWPDRGLAFECVTCFYCCFNSSKPTTD